MISMSAERTYALIAVAGLALVGCSSSNSANTADAQAIFTCPTGETIAVDFATEAEGAATVTLPEQSAIVLPRVEAASGAKYSDDTTTFWEQGGEAMVEVNGEITLQNCTVE